MPKFEPNPNKARINLKRHRVSFAEAETIWQGPVLTELDEEHSDDEIRFTSFGLSNRRRVLRVTHNEEGEWIRLISARPANRKETKTYHEYTRGY